MFQKMILLISLISILSNTSFADSVVYLDKDKPAPYSGLLFPEDQAKNLRNAVLERDSYKTQNDLLNQNLTIQQKSLDLAGSQNKLLTDQNINLSKSLGESQNLNVWEKIAYFTAGILVVGLAVKGVEALK